MHPPERFGWAGCSVNVRCTPYSSSSPPWSRTQPGPDSLWALYTLHFSLAAEVELQIRGARMATSYSAARQGLLRALARSPKLGSPRPATAVRSLTSVQVPAAQQQQQLQLRRETLSKSSWWVESQQQQMQQRRRFAAASGEDEDGSDDDFKPKRKAVPEGSDEVSDLIRKQVRCGLQLVMCCKRCQSRQAYRVALCDAAVCRPGDCYVL